MKFWLSAFVILFVAVELFDWIVEVGNWHASGVWLVLGGTGLAAVSNWGKGTGNWGKGPNAEDEQILKLSKAEGREIEDKEAEGTDCSSDSISFKVRPLKR